MKSGSQASGTLSGFNSEEEAIMADIRKANEQWAQVGNESVKITRMSGLSNKCYRV